MNLSTFQEFMNLLEERHTARLMSKTNIQVEMPNNIKPLFRRLASEGMVPSVEDKLLSMKDNLVKITRHRAMKNSGNEQSGIINLKTIKIHRKSVPLRVSSSGAGTFGGPVMGNEETLNPEIEAAEAVENSGSETGTPKMARKPDTLPEDVPEHPAFIHDANASCK